MSPSTKKLLEEVESWPEEDQEELAEYARGIKARRTRVYSLTADERAVLAESAEDVRVGRFVTDKEIAEIFKKARPQRA